MFPPRICSDICFIIFSVYFCKYSNCSLVTALVPLEDSSPSFFIVAGIILLTPFGSFSTLVSIFFIIFTSARINPFILNSCLIFASISSSERCLSNEAGLSNKLKYRTPAGIKSSTLHISFKYVNSCNCNPEAT